MDLGGLPRGVWQTLGFQIPSADAGKLAAGGYSDLTFTIVLNAPSNEAGHFLFDNLRTTADVVPSLYGIATDSAGATRAVFTYTTASTAIDLPYGQANALLDGSNVFLASPKEAPPRTFVSTVHAPFVATLVGPALTWRIGTHIATATPSSPQLPTVDAGDGTKDAVLPDGRRVNLDSSPPQEASITSADPPLGPVDKGVLEGSLAVTPGGAATYTVPIVTPPGIAGMSPNLALVYNSQLPPGIAGPGWDLTGLSVIHKCPRTKAQDGVPKPITMDQDPIVGSAGGATQIDGVCLDGQRMFEAPPGSGKFALERMTFGSIAYFAADNHFEVKTKAGETRYYGLTSQARITAQGLNEVGTGTTTTTATAVWALERVADVWGNFFYLHYNEDNADFAQSGLRISEIDYTGHMSAGGAVDSAPFAWVKFTYEQRPDLRWSRFGLSRFPKNQHLKTIATPRGTYTLTYGTGTTPSQALASIRYCTGGTCLKDLTFTWSGGNNATLWTPSSGFQLPPEIAMGQGLLGTQLLDLNLDGRPDLAYAWKTKNPDTSQSLAWRNSGTGWVVDNSLKIPAPLMDENNKATRARFGDMDGDGVLDLVTGNVNLQCDPQDQTYCVSCGGPQCQWTPVHYALAVWINKGSPNAHGTIWEFRREMSVINTVSDSSVFDQASEGLVDIDNDGKADIVNVRGTPQNQARLDISLNRGPGQGYTQIDNIISNLPLNNNYHVRDMNRDGLPDLVVQAYSQTAQMISSGGSVAISKGLSGGSGFVEFANPTSLGSVGAPLPPELTPPGPQLADIDGDGFYDEVFMSTVQSSLVPYLGIGSSDGLRVHYGDSTGAGFLSALNAMAPNQHIGAEIHDYAWALADMNGDGLPDLVMNHFNHTNDASSNNGDGNKGGGQIVYNTGNGWKVDGDAPNAWQVGAGPNPVPGAIPGRSTVRCGSALVDLDGNGIVDFLQEEGDTPEGEIGSLCRGSKVGRGSWTSNASAPVITGFPNGRALSATVSYVHISEADAHTDGVLCDGVNAKAVYCDSDQVEPLTKRMPVPPLLVAWKVHREDGTGAHTFADTTYAYNSLRADPDGRGPLGFHRVMVYDHASGVKTETTYAQAFPYTGMPTAVVRTQVNQGSKQLTGTQTGYCASTTLQSDGTPNCISAGAKVSPRTPVFVFPQVLTDTTFLVPGALSAGLLQTQSTYQYDNYGNARSVVVKTSQLDAAAAPGTGFVVRASVTATTSNQYGQLDSEQAKQGKITSVDVVTTSTGTPVVGFTHHQTSFEYLSVSTFGGAFATALALSKKQVEPGAGWPVEVDTAYRYDRLGNLTITTTCASDFTQCAPSAVSPSPVSASHPPFRTTTLSYEPGDFNAPAGPGLMGSIPYGYGRFLVRSETKTISTDGGRSIAHVDFSAYDPIKGVLLQKTDENGVHACFTYDDLGRVKSETARCGSVTPITTTTDYFWPGNSTVGTGNDSLVVPAPGAPANAQLLVVRRSASGATTWAYSDDQGKSIGSLTRGFDAGYVETLTTYDALGRVVTTTKPFSIQSFGAQPSATYISKNIYDGFNRLYQLQEDLGDIDGSGTSRQSVATMTYDGLTITTTRTAHGQTETRAETKNLLGKVQSIVDSLGSETDYLYDPDGDLRFVGQPGSTLVETRYDTRGRKSMLLDADMGTWRYTVDGFGDLVEQIDAKGQHVVMAYDQLDRMLSKQDPATGSTAQWIYDSATGAGVGKISAMVGEPDPNVASSCALPTGATVTGQNRAVKSYAYSLLGELLNVSECADGSSFQTAYGYDSVGRQTVIQYPVVGGKRLRVGYHYTTLGYLHFLTDESSDYGILWQAKAMNALGQVTDEQARNGVETVASRNPAQGWLLGSTSTAHADQNTVIQRWSYTFDEVGDLMSRGRSDQVADAPSSETLGYDALNRLTTSQVTVAAPLGITTSASYEYYPNGNLKMKDGKLYAYDGSCTAGARQAGPHAVCSVAGTSFTYDDNGNLRTSASRTITYNVHNKVSQMTNGTSTIQFAYGADENRVLQVVTSGTTTSRTIYVGLGGTGKSLYERTAAAGQVEHVHFIYAGASHGGHAFAIRTLADDGTPKSTRYLSFDHLGSTTAVADERGHIASTGGSNAELLSYDPWGSRRNPDGAPASAGITLAASPGHRDFTGQETIPGIGLINMNGRVYDPQLARFLSPDPSVADPDSLQSLNRYSYVINNPLRYTDPTGYVPIDTILRYWGYALETVGVAAACYEGGPAGCVAAGAFVAAINATVAIAEGAPFAQTLATSAISFAIGFGIGSAAGEAGGNILESMILGAGSAAATTAITDGLTGRRLGWDVVNATVMGAFGGAVSYGFRSGALVSKAEARRAQGGGGSGAKQLEAGELKRALDAARANYGDDASALGERVDPLSAAARAKNPHAGYFYKLSPAATEALQPLADHLGVDLSSVRIGPDGAWGQGGFTVGSQILTSSRFAGKSFDVQIDLLSHEIVHTAGYNQLGTLGFGTRYIAEYWKTPGYERYDIPDALMRQPINSVNVVDPNYSFDAIAERFRVEYGVRP